MHHEDVAGRLGLHPAAIAFVEACRWRRNILQVNLYVATIGPDEVKLQLYEWFKDRKVSMEKLERLSKKAACSCCCFYDTRKASQRRATGMQDRC